MSTSLLYYISGLLTALLLFSFIIKRAKLQRISGEAYSLQLPLIGNLATFPVCHTRAVFTEDYIQFERNFSRLKSLMDFDKMMNYAIQFNIDYITTEGDLPDGSWSEGRYAFCTMSKSHKREFAIHINPFIDTEDASHKLSLQLQKRISPGEVYPFLFLHEVGHTSKTGNKNYFSAVINHTISGDRHSLSKRRELFRLKSEIEEFADRFALQELQKWQDNASSILSPLHRHSHI
jgi:hypothetical protein